MNIEEAYDSWAAQYDTNQNKTRDLEAVALKVSLSDFLFKSCLEIGCGTGKNSQWLVNKAERLTAVDFSHEMLAKAKQKIPAESVTFVQADITDRWEFINEKFDLLTFSLVLEHIEDLDHVFSEASRAVKPGGYVYVGELHPFKQYSGTKARFDTEDGRKVVECFIHNISDFYRAANKNGLELFLLEEFFDEDDRTTLPRILTMIFRKRSL